ncbi:MAG: type II toxin-antitoxin system RelE/ParE family toxin [Myxococcaceae bacterium]|nr:type II toxin-antitoxin system RelE/ParE family toxin [Myxococcaceae bacterium]
MAQVFYSFDALSDLERIEQFFGEDTKTAAEALLRIFECVALMRTSPELGREVRVDRRELVISRGKTGYLLLYVFEPRDDIVRVLRVRHQREAGYP